jgi:pimeloyl-ACP methyl ester carboxylesterase
MPAERISIPRYVSLVDRLLGQLEIDTATVIGNSMGGLIAAELAVSFPQRAERLVLISPAGISTYGRPVRGISTLRRLEPVAASFTTWVAARSESVTRRPRLRNATMYTLVRHPDRLPAPLAAEQMRGAGKPGFVQALEATLRHDVRDRLPEIACPTLIVWGDGDRVISVRDADVFAELIPNSRKVVFDDTGHMAMLERPAAFNALLRDFLAE